MDSGKVHTESFHTKTSITGGPTPQRQSSVVAWETLERLRQETTIATEAAAATISHRGK